jgi:hypothetical protein
MLCAGYVHDLSPMVRRPRTTSQAAVGNKNGKWVLLEPLSTVESAHYFRKAADGSIYVCLTLHEKESPTAVRLRCDIAPKARLYALEPGEHA